MNHDTVPFNVFNKQKSNYTQPSRQRSVQQTSNIPAHTPKMTEGVIAHQLIRSAHVAYHLIDKSYHQAWKCEAPCLETKCKNMKRLPFSDPLDNIAVMILQDVLQHLFHQKLDEVRHDDAVSQIMFDTKYHLEDDLQDGLEEFYDNLPKPSSFTIGSAHYPKTSYTVLQDVLFHYGGIEESQNTHLSTDSQQLQSILELQPAAMLVMTWLAQQKKLIEVFEHFATLLNTAEHPEVKKDTQFNTLPAFIVYLLTTLYNTLKHYSLSQDTTLPWVWQKTIVLEDFMHNFQHQEQAVQEVYALCSLNIQSFLADDCFE